jgi:hypothetical protein
MNKSITIILLLSLFLTCVCYADIVDSQYWGAYVPDRNVENKTKSNQFILREDVIKLADSPDWVYVPGENLGDKTKSSQLLSFKNITKIELVRMVTQKVAKGRGVIINYAPDSLKKKSILKKEMNRRFLNDVNRMALVTIKREMFICCEINLYERENIIATFKTNGHYFYDEEKHLLYEYQYIGNEMNYTDLLYKYWGIEGYGKYIWVK